MKNNQSANPSNFICNLISRSLGKISQTSISQSRTYYRFPAIKPALTPDMLPNTFRNWELKKREKTDEQNHWKQGDNGDNGDNGGKNDNDIEQSRSTFSSSVPQIRSPSVDSNPTFPPARFKVGEKISGSQDRNNNKSQERDATTKAQMKSPILNFRSSEATRHLVDTAEKKQNISQSYAKFSDSQRTQLKGSEKKLVEETTTTNLTIHVGRIELRAIPPRGFHQLQSSLNPSSSSLSQLQTQTHLSLKDYLKQRSEGRY